MKAKNLYQSEAYLYKVHNQCVNYYYAILYGLKQIIKQMKQFNFLFSHFLGYLNGMLIVCHFTTHLIT